MRRSKSPGRKLLLWLPVTKSSTATRRSVPSGAITVQIPSSATASEIIGPAGNDIQMLPPTVAVFQILNEERNDRQHSPISGAAVHAGAAPNATSFAIGQRAAISRPFSP